MTFTFDSDLTVARDYVRFHTGDTETPGYMSDELIASMVTNEGNNNAAVIAGIKFIIFKLSKPDTKADWLTVSYAAARKGYRELLRDKYTEFGLAKYTASTTHIYRVDSDQDEAPDYDD